MRSSLRCSISPIERRKSGRFHRQILQHPGQVRRRQGADSSDLARRSAGKASRSGGDHPRKFLRGEFPEVDVRAMPPSVTRPTLTSFGRARSDYGRSVALLEGFPRPMEWPGFSSPSGPTHLFPSITARAPASRSARAKRTCARHSCNEAIEKIRREDGTYQAIAGKYSTSTSTSGVPQAPRLLSDPGRSSCRISRAVGWPCRDRSPSS